MVEHRDGSLAAFYQRLRRSPVRWVVLAHVALLATVIGLQSLIPTPSMLHWLDASLVIAQVALLLIWMTLDGRGTVRRAFGVAFVIALIQVAHSPGARILSALPGLICFVPAMFMLVTVLALPLSFAQSTAGLQVQRFDSRNMPPPRRLQFSIRAVLLISVGVALLFGLKGIPESLDQQPGESSQQVAFALSVAAMILVGMAIYLSIPLVAVWAVLTPGKILPRMATALVGWSLGGLLVFHYAWTREQSVPLAGFTGITAGAIVILLATLFVLRAMRYRLVGDTGSGGNPFQPASPFEELMERSSRHAPP